MVIKPVSEDAERGHGAPDASTLCCSSEGGHAMIDRVMHRAVRCTALVSLFLYLVTLFCGAGIGFAVSVGDLVEIKATHQAGIPFYNASGGSHTFQRVPSGTVGTVIGTARNGSWLQLNV